MNARLPLVAVALGLALLACNASSSDDQGGSSAADLSGSVGDARACLVRATYEQATFDDIKQIAEKDFEQATSVSAHNATLCGRFDVPRVGTVYLVETGDGTSFYAGAGVRLAWMSAGTPPKWLGPEHNNLQCDGAAAVGP